MNVLDASIEHAHVQVMIGEDHALHKITCQIENGNRQYLRLKLPEDVVAIWSTYVNSEPTNPVTDKNDKSTLLIPLTAAMTPGIKIGKEESGSVELVYLTRHNKIGDSGTFKVSIPAIDVPINLLTAELLLPNHVTPTISGGMKNIFSFSASIPEPVHKAKSRKVVEKDFNFLKNQYVLEDNEQAMMSDVRVKIPNIGVPFRFEKLLVMDESQELQIEYVATWLLDEMASWQKSMKTAAITGAVILAAFVCFRQCRKRRTTAAPQP